MTIIFSPCSEKSARAINSSKKMLHRKATTLRTRSEYLPFPPISKSCATSKDSYLDLKEDQNLNLHHKKKLKKSGDSNLADDKTEITPVITGIKVADAVVLVEDNLLSHNESTIKNLSIEVRYYLYFFVIKMFLNNWLLLSV